MLQVLGWQCTTAHFVYNRILPEKYNFEPTHDPRPLRCNLRSCVIGRTLRVTLGLEHLRFKRLRRIFAAAALTSAAHTSSRHAIRCELVLVASSPPYRCYVSAPWPWPFPPHVTHHHGYLPTTSVTSPSRLPPHRNSLPLIFRASIRVKNSSHSV